MSSSDATSPVLTPRLVVAGADAAIAFYERAFGARVLERFADGSGHVVHAALEIFGAVISLTDERGEWQNISPSTFGGSPVILNLVVDDVDAVGQALERAGAEVVFPIADHFYGHREGRFRDPFGHLWIITRIIESLTPEQIEARMSGMG